MFIVCFIFVFYLPIGALCAQSYKILFNSDALLKEKLKTLVILWASSDNLRYGRLLFIKEILICISIVISNTREPTLS